MFQPRRKPVVCEDGFTMSVQASEYHYCSPRRSGLGESYTSVEVGFPSEKEDLLMEHAEDYDKPTGTVYPYVPVEVVLQVIMKHGGMVEGDTPNFDLSTLKGNNEEE